KFAGKRSPDRLRLVRKKILKFRSTPSPALWGHFVGQQQPRGGELCWREWSGWILLEDESDYMGHVTLSSLERLTLDFSDWQLFGENSLSIQPFIAKFGKPHKLHELIVKGVRNTLTLDELKQDIVVQDGSFLVDKIPIVLSGDAQFSKNQAGLLKIKNKNLRRSPHSE
ncbi:MAG: hypothetical protein Q9217_005899, partial [Psora testacea]